MNRIPFTKKQKGMLLLAGVIVLGMWGYLLLCYGALPKVVATQFNIDGILSGASEKTGIFILPAAGTAVLAVLALMMKFPSIWNLPVTITKNNEQFITEKTRDMVATLLLLIAVALLYICVCMVKQISLEAVFFPLFLLLAVGLILIGSIYICIKGRKLK